MMHKPASGKRYNRGNIFWYFVILDEPQVGTRPVCTRQVCALHSSLHMHLARVFAEPHSSPRRTSRSVFAFPVDDATR